MSNKPLAFIDLDDTIFQTNRRLKPDNTFRVGSLDKSNNPLSFLTPKQQKFVDWLFTHADVVPVTARPVDGLGRVQLKFEHGAICSFGGTILKSNGQVDKDWHDYVTKEVEPISQLITHMPDALLEYSKGLGEFKSWTVEENNLKLYSYIKQKNPQIGHIKLNQIVSQIPQNIKDQFYLHLNGNNLAVIPNIVNKQNAVKYYLNKYDPNGERFVLGFGDSMSDYGFLSNCDWFGSPKNSQLHSFTENKIKDHCLSTGYFGNV